MTYSILIPTRNRLEYLRYAVESVRRQVGDDWEVIIADNCSDDDVGAYVAALHEPRIQYLRSETVLPVTENWNQAFAASTGDYVLMLGDDDILLPGYVREVDRVLEEQGHPELLYTGAHLFAYPKVMPDAPRGYIQTYSYADFFSTAGTERPFVLGNEVAREVVGHALNFRARFGFNMQFALVSRRLTERLEARGPLYQSPFPDYYAMNALFLEAASIVAWARPSVLIGVTPRSYGYLHATGQHESGRAFLSPSSQDRSREDRVTLLPGSNINDGWLAAMVQLVQRLPDKVPCPVNRRRYRWLQVLHVHEQAELRAAAGAPSIKELQAGLTKPERLASIGCSLVFRSIRLLGDRYATAFANRMVPRLQRGQLLRPDVRRIEGFYTDAMQVFDQLDRAVPIFS